MTALISTTHGVPSIYRGPTMRPFSISVDDAVIDELHARIRRTRWPAAIAGAGWSVGADIDYLRELATYWLDGYDWRAQERMLNERPARMDDHDRRAAGALCS